MSDNGLEGPVRERCDSCGELHTYCPLCEKRVDESERLKNGKWAVHPVGTDVDHVCAEWESGYLWLYFHGESK